MVGLAQTAVIQAMPDSSSIALSARWHFHGLIEVGEQVKNASGKKSPRGLRSATQDMIIHQATPLIDPRLERCLSSPFGVAHRSPTGSRKRSPRLSTPMRT